MISICGCAINAKYEVESLVTLLNNQNPDCDFEVCVTLDGRSRDGSLDHFIKLQEKYKNFKFIYHSIHDTVRYLENLITYYEQKNTFSGELRSHLKHQLNLFKKGKLLNPKNEFLWMSSGYLYNRAVEASSGDVLFITPSDFIYLFKLSRLQNYINNVASNGEFYASPPAIWARITNMDLDWLKQHMNDVHSGKITNSRHRWDSVEVFRDYLKCPEDTNNLYLPDFRHNVLIDLNNPDNFKYIERYCQESLTIRDIQCNPHFHGFHCMTRKTFDKIGGFSEEFYGRAFADDKMTRLGNMQPGPVSLPNEFAVAWCGGYEIENRGPGLPYNWQGIWELKDPFKNFKPKPGDRTCARYLHEPLLCNSDIARLVNQTFLDKRPIRIFK